MNIRGGHTFRPIYVKEYNNGNSNDSNDMAYIYTYYIKYNNIAYYMVIIIRNNGCRPHSIHFMNQAEPNQT